jgi:hypothetical protein
VFSGGFSGLGSGCFLKNEKTEEKPSKEQRKRNKFYFLSPENG